MAPSLNALFRASMAFTKFSNAFSKTPPADRHEDEAEHPSLEVFVVAYDDQVDVRQAIGTTCKGVGVAARASP